MNIATPQKIVVLGFMSHFPVAGVAWQTLHYLLGFERLGYDVYYVEAHGCTPGKLMHAETDDGPARAAAYISGLMGRFGLNDRWAYHSLYDSRYFGLSSVQLSELYCSAALIINLHGSHLPVQELSTTGRLVYLETDPVDLQIDLYHQRKETIDYLTPHCAFFSFGENLGQPDCLVPLSGQFKFIPTRQPVLLDLWEGKGAEAATTFTTIGNWKQPWREFTFKGESFKWSKHLEFMKFLDLPQRVSQPFELALSSYNEADRRLLEGKGWRVRHALSVSQDLDAYRSYIADSRGEFTVAKDQNIRLRSGWFSDRAITYLAAGRPVITQETGFSKILPTGQGLFAFATMDDILRAVEAINADYRRHQKAASQIAHEYMSHDVVLGQLLEQVGLGKRARTDSLACTQESRERAATNVSGSATHSESMSRSPTVSQGGLPGDLVVQPASRWPTRLPVETVTTALAIEPQVATPEVGISDRSASIIMVTHNALHYTKMCVASLLSSGWVQGDELVIVDNASTDGTVDFLRNLTFRHSFVHILLNEQNRGFAAANNQGLTHAEGDILVLLNNDTLLVSGWRNKLVSWLNDSRIGLVGPVTNRTCNEAQVDAPYRTYSELQQFASEYTQRHAGQEIPLSMLAMFCVAMRRDVLEKVGLLDEMFETGMFEDDDYCLRVRKAGLGVVCAEDVFVHHFGQGSLGELCTTGQYERLLEKNRRNFEQKWGVKWQPHKRRLSPEYADLRRRIVQSASAQLPAGATVAIISKGDEELLKLVSQHGWHFPQTEDGRYANFYPAADADAVAQLERVRDRGARFLLIPKPAFWWLNHYQGFKQHLETNCRLALRNEETCLIYELGGCHA